jgi:hypothetical protein
MHDFNTPSDKDSKREEDDSQDNLNPEELARLDKWLEENRAKATPFKGPEVNFTILAIVPTFTKDWRELSDRFKNKDAELAKLNNMFCPKPDNKRKRESGITSGFAKMLAQESTQYEKPKEEKPSKKEEPQHKKMCIDAQEYQHTPLSLNFP